MLWTKKCDKTNNVLHPLKDRVLLIKDNILYFGFMSFNICTLDYSRHKGEEIRKNIPEPDVARNKGK